MEGLFKQNFEGYLKYQDISQQKKPICVNGLIFDTEVLKTSLKMRCRDCSSHSLYKSGVTESFTMITLSITI